MDTTVHKSKLINEYLEKTDGKVNLHQIKEETGAGNGFKNAELNTSDDEEDIEDFTHKSEKIQHVINNTEGKINLHEIKAKTGAGNGHKTH